MTLKSIGYIKVGSSSLVRLQYVTSTLASDSWPKICILSWRLVPSALDFGNGGYIFSSPEPKAHW